MGLPIIENPLYGDIQVETSPWSTPFTWTDHTQYVVGSVAYSEGGRKSAPGSSETDVGTLNVTLKDAATIPAVGALIRLKLVSTSDYAFTGYVQDVSQRVVFDRSVSLTTPITLTTLYCVDWVAYVAQFQAIGAGGANPTTGADETDSEYTWDYRIAALNKIIDSGFTTKLIYAKPGAGSGTYNIGDNDLDGTFAQQLDLLSASTGMRWRGAHRLPTNKTTGRTSLIEYFDRDGFQSSGYTFTDVAGSAGNLHYTEIDFENSTTNVANSIVANNRVRFHVPDVEVTKIGGFNEENFVIVNSTNVIGVGVDSTQIATDSTSITTYGQRQSVIETNAALPPAQSGAVNFITNPSAEYDDNGYSGGSNTKVRRRRPADESTPFAAYNGQWAMRSRQTTAGANGTIFFSGGEADGIPVIAGTNYYFSARVARGTPSATNAQGKLRIIWYDNSEAVISTVDGGPTTLTTADTWYQLGNTLFVAPANAVRATVAVVFQRSSGANISVGDHYWADGFFLSKYSTTYFDGDTPWDASFGYIWTGGVGASPSYVVHNRIDNIASDWLALYSTTSNRVSRIRWNAQEDLSAVTELMVGNTVDVTFDGTTNTYVIVGIDGNIEPERYMIDYYLAKV